MQPVNQANSSASGASGGPGRLIRLPEALALVGLGRSAWLDLVAKRKAPAPVKIGRAALWVEAEVQAFIADRVRQFRATVR